MCWSGRMDRLTHLYPTDWATIFTAAWMRNGACCPVRYRKRHWLCPLIPRDPPHHRGSRRFVHQTIPSCILLCPMRHLTVHNAVFNTERQSPTGWCAHLERATPQLAYLHVGVFPRTLTEAAATTGATVTDVLGPAYISCVILLPCGTRCALTHRSGRPRVP